MAARKFFRGWAINGSNVYHQLWCDSESEVSVRPLWVSMTLDRTFGAVLLAMPQSLPSTLVDFGASSSRGIDLDANLSVSGEIRASTDVEVLGGQMYNFSLAAHFPHRIDLGDELKPGTGLGIRMPNAALVRFGWCWEEEV